MSLVIGGLFISTIFVLFFILLVFFIYYHDHITKSKRFLNYEKISIGYASYKKFLEEFSKNDWEIDIKDDLDLLRFFDMRSNNNYSFISEDVFYFDKKVMMFNMINFIRVLMFIHTYQKKHPVIKEKTDCWRS